MKHLKLKTLAAAVLAIGATSAFAAALPVTCVTTTPLEMVNTCTPDVTLYVAGSSALAGGITQAVTADLFDAAAGITVVKDMGSANGSAVIAPATAAIGGVSAWYGIGKAGTAAAGKKLFVVYNKQNGSAAGISQLLSTIKDTTIPEQDVVTIGPIGKVAGVVAVTQAKSLTANSCIAGAVDVAGSVTIAGVVTPVTYHNVTCTTHARTQADVGLSDVAPAELFALEGAKPGKVSLLTNTVVGIQGFGLAVNAKFHDALQTQNVADGLLPATCVAGDLTAPCQPIIRKADYAALVTATGSIKSAAGFIPGDATLLELARRDDLSGTQAASNIYFADNHCGDAVDSKGKAIKGVLGGSLPILAVTPDATKLVLSLSATGGGVTTALAQTDRYVIGAIGLNSAEPARTATSWKWVRIDGVSPNFPAVTTATTATESNQRLSFANGNYGWAVTSYAAVSTKAAKTSVANSLNAYHGIVANFLAGLKDSTLHNIKGLAYLDGGVAAQQAHYIHTAGNNCSPLIKN
jgi:hypothetical protein